MLSQIRKTIAEYGLLKQGDRVTIGVSGGADSVCLLLCLLELREEYGLTLQAVHVNHCLRGADADADEEFVRRLCEEKGVPCLVRCADAAALARANRQSVEEAGRQLRYRAFFEAAEGGPVAVAHNRDDQCETVLLNLLRGTGLKGLGGMRPKNGAVIRPLLFVSRRQIEAFLAERGQGYRTDATNASPEYTRNLLRGSILPQLEAEINAGTREHLLEAARIAREAWEHIHAEAEAFLREQPEGSGASAEALLALSPAVAEEAAAELIRRASGSLKDVSSVHIRSVAALAGQPVGTVCHLPGGFEGVRTYTAVVVRERPEAEEDLPELCVKPEFRVFDRDPAAQIPEKEYTKWLDYDTISCNACWRRRKTGDTICLDGVGRRKLKDYMIDRKIPAEERDRLPLLADGSRVIWLPGHRIGADFKITEQTRRVAEVSFDPERFTRRPDGGREDA